MDSSFGVITWDALIYADRNIYGAVRCTIIKLVGDVYAGNNDFKVYIQEKTPRILKLLKESKYMGIYFKLMIEPWKYQYFKNE